LGENRARSCGEPLAAVTALGGGLLRG
jgi:hypothetical protein